MSPVTIAASFVSKKSCDLSSLNGIFFLSARIFLGSNLVYVNVFWRLITLSCLL